MFRSSAALVGIALAFLSVRALAQDAPTLDPPGAEGADSEVGDTELEATTVVGEPSEEPGEYNAKTSSTATGTLSPIAEVPVSVQTVPRQVFEDQAALRLEDVYINSSGVVEAGNTLNARSEVLPFIRGFESPFLFRNGMRATEAGAVDLVNIESVEVLKGPASILYGGLEPGGIVNLNTKRPLALPFYEVKQTFGSYNFFRTTFDATGPLDEAKRFLYRVNVAHTSSDSFRDLIELERIAVAPSFTWVIGDGTDLTLDLSYTREETPYDSGVPFGFNSEPLVPIETFFGSPGLEGRTLEDVFVGYQLNHRLNEIFSFRNRFQFHRAHPRNESIRHRGVAGTPGNELLRLRYQKEERHDDEYQLITDMLAEFSTGPLDHQALVGVDLIWQDSDFDRFRQNLPDIPITSHPPRDFVPPANNILAPAFRTTTGWAALYAQDQVSFFEDGRLKVLVGGRLDYVDQEQDVPTRSATEDTALTGRAGVLYELTDWVAPYASVSQSFRPQSPSTVDRMNDVLDPERGIQYEGGLKFELFEERLLATVAVYQIEKEDVAVFDQQFFNDTGETAFFPGVEQRSRGVELDVVGQITSWLSVIGNYAYTDTEVLENPDDPAMEGQRLGGVPLHALRIWLAYDSPPGSCLEGFGVGAGPRFESDRKAQFDDSVNLDEFVVLDAAAWYRFALAAGPLVKLQLNVRNVLDEDFYPRASDRSIVHPGEPLTVFGSIAVEF